MDKELNSFTITNKLNFIKATEKLPKLIIICTGSDIIIYNTTTNSEVDKIKNAHYGDATCCDSNPNKGNYFVSTGEDNYLKFWDLRKLNAPICMYSNPKCYKLKTIKYNCIYMESTLSLICEH